ncbi:hypothetical protein FSOLCH5_008068 [Fusarium solani]|jgi:uncharacterized protein (DUF427 family)|uniref:DUF427 domain-containing protein n=1 Tax=Fusarium sp. TaxID=29916 RepID=A0A6S6A6R3_FUSSX|nr:hypothetical protein MRS44_011220 [Fusarium solani]BBU37370.1 hypothetical protein [Fusarium sp.]
MQRKQGIIELGRRLVEHGPKRTLEAARRVRAIHNHTVIADTTKGVYVWEHDFYPAIYVPQKDLINSKLSDKEEIRVEGKGLASLAELIVSAHDGLEEVKVENVLRFDNDKKLGALAGLLRIEFGSIGMTFEEEIGCCKQADIRKDQWLEEDAPIYVHPKDPFKRVDILPSQRPIEVQVNGKTVAKASSSMHLFETGLPTRYYLPLGAIDQSVLRKSDLKTKCPYKGEAEYYHVVVDGQEMKNLAWYYRLPTHESAAIAGLVCFYNEKVDTILDGEPQPRPKTHFA